MRTRTSTPRSIMFLLTGLVLALVVAGGMRAQAQSGFLDSQFQICDISLSSPSAIAVDVHGNVYVADSGNNRVVKIPATSTGFGHAVAITANLSSPTGVAFDLSGNLYISDSGNNRVVMLAAMGAGLGSQATVASGLSAPGGLAVDTTGNLFVADTGNSRVVKFPAQGSGFGAAVVIGSGFNAAASVALDSANNLYVADTGNNRVAKLTFASGYGTAVYYFTGTAAPAGIAVDGSFNMYVPSPASQRIYYEPWNAAANRFNGAAAEGSGWIRPVAVAAGAQGNVFAVDAAAGQVWEIPATPAVFTAAAGSLSTSQVYTFSLAAGTTIGGYGVLTQGAAGRDFADAGGSSCTAQTVAVATFCSVTVQFQPAGTGSRQGAVVLYDGSGNAAATAYLSGIGTGSRVSFYPAQQVVVGSDFSGPSGVAVDAFGNVYVADTGNNRIVEVPSVNGNYGTEIPLPTTQINTPMGLAVDGAGNLFIASSGNDKIVELPRTQTGFGTQIKVPMPVYGPAALTFDGNGTIYVADTFDNRILKMAWKGSAYGAVQYIGIPRMPMGIAVDAAFNSFYSFPYQNNVGEGSVLGTYQPVTYLKASKLSMPTSVVTDSNGNVYVLDSGNNRVVMYPATGLGWGAQVTVATGFNGPVGMAMDISGNLYVADTGNNRVVRINLGQPGTLSFASTFVKIQASGAQTAVIENTGNVPATVESVAYANDFPEDAATSNSCVAATVLAPGSGCPVAADFFPQTVGTLSESLPLSISAGGVVSPVTVPVTGVSMALPGQTISFTQAANVVYGAAAFKVMATATSGLAVSYQLVSGPATVAANGTVTATGAGTVTVAAKQGGNASYQAAPTATMTFNVLPATLTVKVASATATYGAIPASFAYTVSGMVLGQTASQAFSGAPLITVDAGVTAGAGTHALLGAIGTLKSANYQFAFTPGTLTVTRAGLQIVAAAATMPYGGSLPKFGWTAAGFVNGDTTAVLSGAPSFATPASSRSATGSYSLTPSVGTLTVANYTFSFTSSTLTVVPAVLTITADSKSMMYGSALPGFTFTVQGLQGADTAASALSGAPAFTTQAGPAAKVGSYALGISAGTLKATSYSLSFVSGTVNVTQAPLTVTPATVTMTYGQSVPTLSALQLSGLVNGDTQATALSGSPALGTTATAGTPAGKAVISIAQGTLASGNYSLNLQPGTLVINPAALTVTVTAASRSYGAANPVFSYTISGFVHGDTAATAVSGAPVLTTAAVAGSPVGSYAVSAAVGTMVSPSYSFTFVGGTLTVAKAALTVSANPLSMTYGAALPHLGYTIAGFQNGETASVLTGSPVVTTTAAATPAAGSYPLTVGLSGVSAANYTMTGVNGTLTVAKAAATVTADNLSSTVGNAIPTLTYTVSGMVAGDQASAALTGAPTLSTTATKSSAAGTYAISVVAGTMAAKNYTLTMANGTLTLNKAAGTVVSTGTINPRLPSTKLP